VSAGPRGLRTARPLLRPPRPTDRGHARLLEFVRREPQQEGRLADARVADEEDLEARGGARRRRASRATPASAPALGTVAPPPPACGAPRLAREGDGERRASGAPGARAPPQSPTLNR